MIAKLELFDLKPEINIQERCVNFRRAWTGGCIEDLLRTAQDNGEKYPSWRCMNRDLPNCSQGDPDAVCLTCCPAL